MILAVSTFRNGEISFVYKYVDDIIGAVDRRYINKIQESIESLCAGLKLKIELEDDNNEVIYLNAKVGRDIANGNSIHVKWFQKEHCAKRILDFHSYHPQHVKNNVVKEFVKSSLKISSSRHWKEVLRALRKVLRNSSYPNRYISDKISFVLKE